MNCPKFVDVSAYVDNMLPAAERQQLAAHMQDCPHCRQRAAELIALHQGMQALPSPALGFDLATRFAERARADRVRHRPVRSFWLNWGPPGLAVAASLASGVWLGGLVSGGAVTASPAAMVRVFDPVPPGGLCAAAELCRASKGLQ